ncbi:RHS repeat protein, partial [Streptomyces sp. NPDC086080]
MTLVAYLLASLLGGPVAAAAELELRKLQQPDPVPVTAIKGKKLSKPDETAKRPFKPDSKARWPSPGAAPLTVGGVKQKPQWGKAGSLPVAMSTARTPGKATAVAHQTQVQVLDHGAAEAVGIDGVLVAVQGHGPKSGQGRLNFELDYSSFAGIYGGDWDSRLVLREVPACALSTPGKKNCVPGKVLETRNDHKQKTLSAEVTTKVIADSAEEAGVPVLQQASPAGRTRMSTVTEGTTLLAVTAAPSGANGNFTATSLSPSGKWEAGGSSGGFSWTYGMQTPSVPGGLEPDLGLSYSSQAVDGRTAAT